MKRRDLILTGVILVFINLAWIWRVDQNRKDYRTREAGSRELSYRLNLDNQMLKLAYLGSVGSDMVYLSPETGVCDKDLQIGPLVKYIGTSEKLVLFLSDRHCSSCIEEVLFLLKKVAFKIGSENILVAYKRVDSPQSVWLQRKLIIPDIPFVELRFPDGSLPMDTADFPCFFITGPSMITGMTYIFLPSMDKSNAEYLEMVGLRFQNANKL